MVHASVLTPLFSKCPDVNSRPLISLSIYPVVLYWAEILLKARLNLISSAQSSSIAPSNLIGCSWTFITLRTRCVIRVARISFLSHRACHRCSSVTSTSIHSLTGLVSLASHVSLPPVLNTIPSCRRTKASSSPTPADDTNCVEAFDRLSDYRQPHIPLC